MKYPMDDASFYSLFEQITGAPIVCNDETVGMSQVSDPHVSQRRRFRSIPFISCSPGASDQEGDIPLETTEAIFHGDVFRFQINMNQVVIRPVVLP